MTGRESHETQTPAGLASGWQSPRYFGHHLLLSHVRYRDMDWKWSNEDSNWCSNVRCQHSFLTSCAAVLAPKFVTYKYVPLIKTWECTTTHTNTLRISQKSSRAIF